jgi:hypothetical protein
MYHCDEARAPLEAVPVVAFVRSYRPHRRLFGGVAYRICIIKAFSPTTTQLNYVKGFCRWGGSRTGQISPVDIQKKEPADRAVLAL